MVMKETLEYEIIFLGKDIFWIHQHENYFMVIIIRCVNLEIKHVLTDLGSFVNIIYYDAFKRLRLNPNDLITFKGSLVDFSSELVQVKGYITLQSCLGEKEGAKIVNVRYLVVNAFSSYSDCRLDWF